MPFIIVFTVILPRCRSFCVDRKVKIENIWTTIDCGLALNKDNIKNQLEGAAIFGMSLAMYGKISTKDGAVEQNNFL